jgi:hypothetical protein
MELPDLRARAGIEFLGQYRSSDPNWKRATRSLSQPVKKVARDHVIERKLGTLASGLVDWRDNRSVTAPEWVAEGLARYGCPIHAVKPDLSSSDYEFTVSELGACSCRRDERSTRTAKHVRSVPTDYETPISEPSDLAGTSRRARRDPKPGVSTGTSLSSVLGSDDPSHNAQDRRTALPSDEVRSKPRLRAGRSWDARAYRDAFSATLSVAGEEDGGREPYPLDVVVDRYVHKSHYAGAPYFTRNKFVLDKALRAAERIWTGDRGFDPYMFGRRVQPGPSGPKTRLVWMASLNTSIVGAAFSKRVHSNLERRRPFAIGLRAVEKGALVSELESRFRYVYSLDWSGFDASAPAFMLDDVFRVLRTHLKLDDQARSVWDRYVSDFIHSRIITPDGTVFQKHKGIPSGSAFTSIVGSVLNLLLMNYVLIKLTGAALKSDRVWIQGDDVIFASNSEYDLGSLARYAAELGFTLSVMKSQVIDTHAERTKLEDYPHFLGHRWMHGWAHRDPMEILQREVYPERHAKRSKKESLIRLYSYLTDAWEAHEIFSHVYPAEESIHSLTMCLDEIGDDDFAFSENDLPGQLRYYAAVLRESDQELTPIKGLALGLLPLIF